MSNIDKQALREAAEKATPGEWKRMMRNSDELMTTFHGVAIGNVFVELTTGKRDIFDAEFIAAANPATVLALLDELEESQRLRLKFQEANCELCQKLEAAEKTSAARLGAIDTTHKMFQRERDRAEKAEKRIAELERKEQHSERQSVIDALAGSGEEWSDIEEYMQKWDAERASAAGKGE